ncbi:hypothetical protein ABIF66_005012 [Bradyrhizobium japonicum]
MNKREFTARKLALFDQAVEDARLSAMDCRLLWAMYSVGNGKTGVIRRLQTEFAEKLRCSVRYVQLGRDRLVDLGYLVPNRKPGGDYVGSYTLPKANPRSPLKGEPWFASGNKNANAGSKKGERPCKKGERPFVHDPLKSLPTTERPMIASLASARTRSARVR